MLVKHLSTVWSWHSVLPYSMLCYNGYSSPNLNGYNPYELVFGHKMTLSHELEIKVDTVVSGTFKDYYEKLKKNLQYMGERLQKFRSQRLDLLNKDRGYQAFEVGQIVYMSCISKTTCFSVNCAPLSLQFGWNEEPKGSKGSRPSECGNQTPPSKLDTAPFLHGKASANQRLSCH